MRLLLAISLIPLTLTASLGQPESAPRPKGLPADVHLRVGSNRFCPDKDADQLAFSPDGRMLLSVHRFHLEVWDVDTGERLVRWDRSVPKDYSAGSLYGPSAAAWDGDGETISWVFSQLYIDPRKFEGQGHLVHCRFRLGKGEIERKVLVRDGDLSVEVLAISPRHDLLAWGDGKNIRFIALSSGAEQRRVAAENDLFGSLQFSHDGQWLVSTGLEKSQLFEVATGKEAARWDQGFSEESRPCFSPDSKYVAHLHFLEKGGSIIRLFNLSERNETDLLQVKSGNCVFLKRDQLLVRNDYEDAGQLVTLDAASGPPKVEPCPSPTSFTRATVHSGRQLLAINSGYNGPIGLWDTKQRAWHPASARPVTAVRRLLFGPDHKTLYVESEGLFKIDVEAKGPLEEVFVDHQQPGGTTFDPLGSRRAFVNSEPRLVVAGVNGKIQARLEFPSPGGYSEFRFTPDGQRLLLFVNRHGVWQWHRPEDGRPNLKLPLVPLATFAAFSGSSKHLVTRHLKEKGYRVTDLETNQIKCFIPMDGDLGPLFSGIALSTSGKLAASLRSRSELMKNAHDEVWELGLSDATTGKSIRRAMYPKLFGQVLAFSPDDKLLAAQLAGGIIELRDVESGTVRHRFQGNRQEITALAFSGDGRWLAAASRDAPVYVFRVPDKLLPRE